MCSSDLDTLSNTLFFMSDVQLYSSKISLADRGMSMKALLSGYNFTSYKTYYIKEVTGAIHECSLMRNEIIFCTGPATRFIGWKGI